MDRDMKKWLCATLLIFTCACGDEFVPEEPKEDTSGVTYTVEDFYKSTGCWYEDFLKIKVRNFFGDVDENQIANARYLYGSKDIKGGEAFLMVKFDSSGNKVWETLKEEKGSYTYAFNPILLDNESFVIGHVTRTSDSLSIADICPYIVYTKDGTIKETPVGFPFFYDKVDVYENFFICSLSESERSKYPSFDGLATQISHKGDVLNKAREFTKPAKGVYWKDHNWYIDANESHISKKHIVKDEAKEEEWTFSVDLPKFTSCEKKISLENDSVSVIYDLVFPTGETSQISYRLSYKTGEPTIPITIRFKEDVISLLVGAKKQTEVVVTPENTDLGELIYSSEDTKVATVDAKGVITAKAAGSTTIAVTTKDGSYKTSCTVNVTHFTEKITISTSGSVMNIGGYVTAVVTVRLSNYSGKTIQVKRFSVLNGSGSEIHNEDINESLADKHAIARSLQYQNVYMPTYKYTYTVDGKQYEVTFSE